MIGILVQDIKKKKGPFHVIFKEVKAHLLLTAGSFVQALLNPTKDAVLKNQQLLCKMQKPTVCFASITSAMLSSTPCKCTVQPVTAHKTSKEKYSRLLGLPMPFHLGYKGMQHHRCKHRLMVVGVNFFISYDILFSDGEKWDREEKQNRVGW